MLKDKSIFNWVEELDNQAAETICGGEFNPDKLPPGAAYIDAGPETHWTVDCNDQPWRIECGGHGVDCNDQANAWRKECGGSGENVVEGVVDWGEAVCTVFTFPFGFIPGVCDWA